MHISFSWQLCSSFHLPDSLSACQASFQALARGLKQRLRVVSTKLHMCQQYVPL